MKVTLLLLAVFGTAGSAARALLQMPTSKHPILEWMPVILVAAGIFGAFVLWRANQGAMGKTVDANQVAVTKLIDANQATVTKAIEEHQRETALDLAKKIDREVFDLRFSALEREMRLHLEMIKTSLVDMRADADRDRNRQHSTMRGVGGGS